MSPRIGQARAKLTLLHAGKYYRATVGATSKLIEVGRRIGIVEVGKHWRLSGFRVLLRQGKLQEITREQALRLLQMLPPAQGTKPEDYAPRKHKGMLQRFYLEPELVLGIKRLGQKRKTPAARLIRGWIRLGYALAMDQERGSE